MLLLLGIGVSAFWAVTAAFAADQTPLRISVSAAPSTVDPGDQVGYDLVVKNFGTVTATGVVLSDLLPVNPGLSWTISPSSPDCSIANGSLDCAIGDLSAHATAKFHLSSPTTVATCGTISDSASVTAANSPAFDSGSVSIVVKCPTLAVTLASDAPLVSPGQAMGFTVGVLNRGPALARSVTAADLLPSRPGLVWSVDRQPRAGSCLISTSAPQQDMTCDLGNLAAGASVTWHFSTPTTGAAGGAYTDSVTATPTNGPSASATATSAVAAPRIEVTKSHSGTLTAGGEVVYTVTVTNSGSASSNDLYLTEEPGDGLTITNITGPSIAAAYPLPSTVLSGTAAQVQMSSGLGPGASRTYTVSAMVDPNAPTTINNTAVYGNSGAQGVSSSDPATVTPAPTPLLATLFGTGNVTMPAGESAHSLVTANDPNMTFSVVGSLPSYLASSTATVGGFPVLDLSTVNPPPGSSTVVVKATDSSATSPYFGQVIIGKVTFSFSTQATSSSFTYLPPPAFGAVSPDSGPSGTPVVISGDGFAVSTSPTVTLGGALLAVGAGTASQLSGNTPTLPAGPADLTITNPDNQSVTQTNAYTTLVPCSALPTAAISVVSVSPPPQGDGLFAPNATLVFRGDLVSLAATGVSSTCPSPVFSYAWTLTPPAGSSATLSSPTSPTPSFVPDLPAGTYQLSLVVSDQFNNQSAPVTLQLITSPCGANPVSVQISTLPGALPGDPSSLSAAATDADNDPTSCPDRFATTFTYSWSLASGNGTFSAPTASSTQFTPTAVGTNNIQVDVAAASGQSGLATVAITVTCDAPVAAPSILAVNGASFTGQTIQVSNLVQAGGAATDSCSSTPTYNWAWAITNRPAGSTATLSSTSAQDPTFTPDQAGSYTLSLTTTDGTGLTSPPSLLVVGVVPPAPTITSPQSGTTTTATAIAVTGTGLPGAAITVFDGTSAVATAVVGPSGGWTATVVVTPGTNSLTATQTVNNETSPRSSAVSVTMV